MILKSLVTIALGGRVLGVTQPASATEKVDSPAITGTYAIQNVQTGSDLRPKNAGKEDGNAIVLYTHWRWKCMTWQFVRTSGETYHLINRYTGKTFQPEMHPTRGVALQQQTSGNRFQEWELIKLPNATYLMRLKGSELYITARGSKSSVSVVLMPKQNSTAQQWRLVTQDPWF